MKASATKITVSAVALLVAGMLGAWATQANPAAPSDPDHVDDVPQAPDRSAIAFLEGTWRATMPNGDRCEETWSAPDANGAVMGMFRWIGNNGDSRFVEIMTLREETHEGEAVVVYRLRHFGMDLSPWEEEPITLHLTESAENSLVLKPVPGAESNGVRSIAYRLEPDEAGNDRLLADAVFERDGEPDPLAFVFERLD